jgi:hypothetical protein
MDITWLLPSFLKSTTVNDSTNGRPLEQLEAESDDGDPPNVGIVHTSILHALSLTKPLRKKQRKRMLKLRKLEEEENNKMYGTWIFLRPSDYHSDIPGIGEPHPAKNG